MRMSKRQWQQGWHHEECTVFALRTELNDKDRRSLHHQPSKPFSRRDDDNDDDEDDIVPLRVLNSHSEDMAVMQEFYDSMLAAKDGELA
eukprot:12421835-Karenia_brevis.AAC.1